MNFNKRYPLMKGDGGGSGGGGTSTGPGVTSGDGSSVTSGDGSAVTSGNYGQVTGSNGMLGDPANVSPTAPTDSGYSTNSGQDNNYSDYYSFSAQPTTEAPAVGPVAADAGVAGDVSKSLSVDAKESAKDPSESQGLVGRIAAYNPNASPSSVSFDGQTDAQTNANIAAGPLSFQRQSEVTGISTADMNNAAGRPAGYNPDNKSRADRVFDATNPTPGGALAKAGWRGIGMTANDMHNQESMNPGMREARNDSWGGVVNGVGNLALNMVPGMGIIRAGADTINNINAGQSVGGAVASAGKSILGGFIGSKINGAIGGVIGPSASNALSMYNKGATVVNALGGSAPTVNPGGMIAGAMLGRPGTPVSATGGAGTTNMDGSHLPSPNWSSAGSALAGSSSAPTAQQPQVVAPVDVPAATADASLYGKSSMGARQIAAKKYFTSKQSRGW